MMGETDPDPMDTGEQKNCWVLVQLQHTGKHDLFRERAKEMAIFTRIKILKEFIAKGNFEAFDLLLPCIEAGPLITLLA